MSKTSATSPQLNPPKMRPKTKQNKYIENKRGVAGGGEAVRTPLGPKPSNPPPKKAKHRKQSTKKMNQRVRMWEP